MYNNIRDILSSSFKNYNLQKLECGASYREYYRLKKNNKSFILLNSSKEPEEIC